jgi:hypothetical protein
MAKRVFWICVLIVIVAGSFWYYKRRTVQLDAEDGSVNCVGCMTGAEKEKFLKENAGDDADGQKEHKSTRGNNSAADAKPIVAPASPAPVAATAPATPAAATPIQTSTATTSPAPVQPAPSPAPESRSLASVIGNTFSSTSSSAGPPPAGDSQSPNAPNGAIFTGSGAYQWYRQGNLTWRVDSRTGRSCIVFATDEEWRKERVLSHGCGKNA